MALEELEREVETSATDTHAAFEWLLAKGKASSGIGSFVEVSKDKSKKYRLTLTPEGEALHKTYEQASRLAGEKGLSDRDVLSMLGEIESKWPSYSGIVENAISEAVEMNTPEKALEIGEKAVADWMATIAKAKVKSEKNLDVSDAAGHLFTQLLANYEFALERSNNLEQALDVALLSRALDPTDPENVLSSIVSLYIRTGQSMSALRALEPMTDSLAPYVLYGRALAYYALGQHENARGAILAALRNWPDVATALTREWKGGTPMPKPGEAVSELQVLYGYYEVFGSAWKSVPGSIEWLKSEAQAAMRGGARRERYFGLTRSGLRTDTQGNVVVAQESEQTEETRAAEQAELIRKGQVIGEDEFVRLLEVQPNVYVYDLTERGKELEEAHNELYRKDMKLGARIEAIEELLREWPGHANAAIAVVRYYAQKQHFEKAVDLLEPVIFDLQKFWPDDLVGAGRIPADWNGNKPLLTAYAYMVLCLAESGDHASAKAYAADYLAFNPQDNMGVRQKAIEVLISDGEYAPALQLINEASDPISAYNVFGRALIGFAVKAPDAEQALANAVRSRPLIWREMNSDKHRMPHNYNPSFVQYHSPAEAYNYNETWAPLWMRKHGALAWLKKEGRKYLTA